VPDIQVLDVISTAPVGLPITATLGAALGGEPYNDVDVKFQVFDAAGSLVYSGSGERLGGGRFRLEIPADVTRKLKPGVYTLSIVAVAADAAVPVLFTRSIVLTPAAEQIVEEVTQRVAQQVEEVGQRVGREVGPALETLSRAIGDLANSVRGIGESVRGVSGKLDALSSKVDTATEAATEARSAVANLQGALNLTNGLLVLVVILLLANLAISLRRPRGGTVTR